MLQELDLSQCSFRQDFLAEDVRHLLDGNSFATRRVGGSASTELCQPHIDVRNSALCIEDA